MLVDVQRQIGKRVKALRAERKMKQQELAAVCDLEKTHLSYRGRRPNLTLKMPLRIANALETDVKDISK